jgi:hypothetical protein
MVNKIKVFFALVIFLLPAALFAQLAPDYSGEAEDMADGMADEAPLPADSNPAVRPGSSVESPRYQEGELGMLFVQHLEWEASEYASRYEVVVERKQINAFSQVLRRIVEVPFLDVSVRAGEYRYKISSFNILGRLDAESDWVYFNVVQAMQPSVFNYSPENFYFDRPSLRIIQLEGINLLVDSEIYLLRRGWENEAPPEGKEAGDGRLVPREIRRNELGDTAQLVFAEEDLIAGVYDIIVINPGGLETATGPFGISVAKPFDINVSLGYSPLIRLYGNPEYVRYMMGPAIVPVSFGARASFVPFKWDIGFLGVELNPNWSYIFTETEGAKITAHILSVHVNALYQYWFTKNILALNARLGVGFTSLLDYSFEYNTGAVKGHGNFTGFSFDLGASVQWLFYKQLFLEGGLDYFHFAAEDLPMGFVRVMVGLGWQF